MREDRDAVYDGPDKGDPSNLDLGGSSEVLYNKNIRLIYL